MKTILISIIFFGLYYCAFSQTERLDKIELKDGKIFLGKVEKIKIDAVEFREKETNLLYEFEKSQIRYIALSNGKILTFENKSTPQTTFDSQTTPNISEIKNSNAETKNLLYLGGGVTFPLSPKEFSDYWNMGYNLEISLDFGISPIVYLGLEIDYNSFGFNGEKLFKDAGFGSYNFTISGGEASILSAMFDLKIALVKGAFQPYILLGIGYNNLETNDATVSLAGVGRETVNGSSEGGFAYNAGLGFNIPLSVKIYLFFEGKYQSVRVKDENTSFLPLRIGIAFSL